MQIFDLNLQKTKTANWALISTHHNGRLQSLADIFRDVGIDLKLTLGQFHELRPNTVRHADCSRLQIILQRGTLFAQEHPSTIVGSWRANPLEPIRVTWHWTLRTTSAQSRLLRQFRRRHD
jgi:hypothetical protein